MSSGGGSWVTFLGGESKDQLGPSTQTPEQENDTTHGRILSQLLKQTFMIQIVLQELECDYRATLNTPNEQFSQSIPGLHPNIRKPEHQGTLQGVVPEHTCKSGQLGEATQHAGQSGGSGGEFQLPDTILSINIYQFQTEPRSTQCLRLLPFLLMPQRNP